MMIKKVALNWAKDLAPALIILFISSISAIYYGDFAPLTKWHVAAWMVPLRFVRFAGILCIPLFILPKLYCFIVRKMSGSLIRLDQKEDVIVSPFTHWFFRPMQGIGIGLIFSTKLIAVLQLISGPVDASSILVSEGHFQFARLITVTLITIAVSLLLSTLWTFDDIGIRYFNKKDQELKMIGKYAGTILPFVFGIYGILNLLANYPAAEAFFLVFKITVVLYPPMVVFTVLHAYFIKQRAELLRNNNLKKAGIYFQ